MDPSSPDQPPQTSGDSSLPAAEAETPFKCHRCDATFANKRTLEYHLQRRRTKGCVGCWFVCRRCLRIFNINSDLLKHQTSPCLSFNAGAQLRIAAAPPPELTNLLQLRKGAEECNGMERYIEHALERRDRNELMNALEGMTLDELKVMFGVVAVCDDSVSKIDSLAALADYANLKTTSAEKRALIKPFIFKHTSF